MLVFLAVMIPWTSSAAGVPAGLAYQGFLADQAGNPVTASKQMRFGIYVDGARVWYAEYQEVGVTVGFFSVLLGDAAQGGFALDPLTGEPLPPGALPVGPQVFVGVSDAAAVEMEIEIHNGSVFETLSPRIRKSSSAFALRADTVDGYDSSQLVKLDAAGSIISSGGMAVVAADGTWTGPVAGLAGPAGPQGPPGVITDNSVTAAKLSVEAVTDSKQFKHVYAMANSKTVIADCGAGFTAVGGGADCTKGSRLMASCPCASTMCTACADGALPARYWLGVCSSANVQNKAFAFCVRN